MNNRNIHIAWNLLKIQIKGLDVPWLENMVNQSAHKRDPFRVLVSCILSLRTQDRTTGIASERLLKLAPDIEKMSKLSASQIEKVIYPVGFYKVKAQRLKEICETLKNNYASKVPDEIDELLQLRGVGRKTANLVITLGYKKPGICVDTHVHRITNRWGYVRTKTPEQTEFALRKKLPQKYWLEINGMLVAFGQGICKPVSPFCSKCSISKFCDRAGVQKYR